VLAAGNLGPIARRLTPPAEGEGGGSGLGKKGPKVEEKAKKNDFYLKIL
jgi:hypothetical protein